jgi:hypothetical protein
VDGLKAESAAGAIDLRDILGDGRVGGASASRRRHWLSTSRELERRAPAVFAAALSSRQADPERDTHVGYPRRPAVSTYIRAAADGSRPGVTTQRLLEKLP